MGPKPSVTEGGVAATRETGPVSSPPRAPADRPAGTVWGMLAHTETLAERMESALQGVRDNEKAEALVLGLGVAGLCILLGYALSVLSRCPLGLLALGLG